MPSPLQRFGGGGVALRPTAPVSMAPGGGVELRIPQRATALVTAPQSSAARARAIRALSMAEPARMAAPPIEDDRPWWQRAVSSVFDNPMVRSMFVPLQIADSGRQAIASTAKEAIDLGQGEGFSPSEWYEQATRGGLGVGEDFGVEDILDEETGWAGGWQRSLAGFVGDVLTDPLTYLGGAGVAARLGRETLEESAKRAAMLGGREAAEMAARRAPRTLRMGVAGRGGRMSRVAEAVLDSFNRGELDDALRDAYGRVTSRGLGASAPEVARARMGITEPALRFRRPFSKTAGTAVPLTNRPAQALADATGAVRERLNRRLLKGSQRTSPYAASVPTDYENAYKILARGSDSPIDEYLRAATAVTLHDAGRRYAGRMNAIGMRTADRSRRQIMQERKAAGDARDYIRRIEDPATPTTFNKVLDEVGLAAPKDELGVTVPKLSTSDIDYFPHSYHPDFSEYISLDRIEQAELERLGRPAVSTQQESGRLASRNLRPGLKIELKDPLGNERSAEVLTGSVDDIERVARELGYEGPVFRNLEPMPALEEYIQVVSDDVGRRAARADAVVADSPFFMTSERYRELAMRRAESKLLELEPAAGASSVRRIVEAYIDDPDEFMRVVKDSGSENLLSDEVLEVLEGLPDWAKAESVAARATRVAETNQEIAAARRRAAPMANDGILDDAPDVVGELPEDYDDLLTFNEAEGDLGPFHADEASTAARLSGVSDDDLVAFDTAVIERARSEGIPIDELTARMADDLIEEMMQPGWGEAVERTLRDQFALLRGDPAARYAGSVAPGTRLDNFKDVRGVNSMNVMIDEGLDEMLVNNIRRATQNPHMFARAFWYATRFFKTYALLSGGYHIRNGYSATFMNFADGVSAANQVDGFRMWGAFEAAARKNGDSLDEMLTAGRSWLDDLPRSERQAFDAVFGSGAGGRYKELGVLDAGAEPSFGGKLRQAGAKASQRVIDHPLTRFSQRFGIRRIEGPVRLSMALDTIRNGGTVSDAMQRIQRVHFDYSQLSRLDEATKMAIPFWTFMSRNLPLQVAQMWTRPSTYARYNSFRRNFSNEDGTADIGGMAAVPSYIRDRGAFGVNIGPFNVADPDLPFVRIQEDTTRYANALSSPTDAAQVLSELNPVITAPIEFMTSQDLYTGRRYDDSDVEHISNPYEWLLATPTIPFGGVRTGPNGAVIDQRYLNAIEALNPLVSRANRVSAQAGSERERIPETIARWMGGLPLRTVTQEQADANARSQYYDTQDLMDLLQAIEMAPQDGR